MLAWVASEALSAVKAVAAISVNEEDTAWLAVPSKSPVIEPVTNKEPVIS